MRYFWPIARIVFCPLTILFIYLTVTEPSEEKQEQSVNMPQELILQIEKEK